MFWCIKKLLNDRIRVQYSDPDLPGLIRIHPAITFAVCSMATMKGTVQEDDYRTEVRVLSIEIFEKFQHKMVASSGSPSRICCNWRIQRFGSGPKSGSRSLIDGISPGGNRGLSPYPDPNCVPTNRVRGPTNNIGPSPSDLIFPLYLSIKNSIKTLAETISLLL
jgi:hypothetical protein